MTTTPSITDPLELDPTGKTVLQQLAYLRDQGPAPRVLLPGGLHARAIVDGELVRKLLRDPRVSKDAHTHWPYYRKTGEIPPWLAPLVDVASMLTAGGTEHTRLKKLISQAFNRASIDAMRPAIETIVRELIEDLAARQPGARVDLRATFAYKIPAAVICALFGVPAEQRPQIIAHMDAVLDTSVSPEAAAANGRGLGGALSLLVETKRRHPGDDLTTRLLQAHEEEDRLSERELKDTLLLIIGAGSETVIALIDHGIIQMLLHPRTEELIEASAWEDIVEETLRGFPSITFFPMRFATEDIALGQDVITQGTALLIAFGGHGRDPAIHEKPGTWDPARPGKSDHLAFGHGIHYCLGAPLARMEACIALKLLFDAFPRMEATEPLEEQPLIPSFMAYDCARVPVVLTPAPG